MYRNVLVFAAFALLGLHVCHTRVVDESNIASLSVYYDPTTRIPLRITSIQNSLVDSTSSYDQSSTKTSGLLNRRVGFRSNGCTCQQLTCGCCLGLNIQQFNFNREGCMNFTYDPNAFSITMDLFMNNNLAYTNTISAKNPPPLCLPIQMPYVPLPPVDFCAKLFDIHTPGQNLHMCFDFETKIDRATVLILHFDCMRMGNDGVMVVKPGFEGPQEVTTTESQVDIDTYDEVTEIKYKNASSFQ